MRKYIISSAGIVSLIVLVILAKQPLYGFGNAAGTCGGDCRSCHSLSKQEAQGIIKELNPDVKVVDVDIAPVGGLWEVVFEFRGQKGITYIDFSKENLVEGKVISLKTKKDVTQERMSEINKVDLSKISTKGDILMGKADARYKVIVFDDPD